MTNNDDNNVVFTQKKIFLKQFDQRTSRAMIFVDGEDFMVNEYVVTQKLRSMGYRITGVKYKKASGDILG